MLTVPFGKSGIKKEDIMERCRTKLVAAMKTGSIQDADDDDSDDNDDDDDDA
jgi:hypothetical protein